MIKLFRLLSLEEIIISTSWIYIVGYKSRGDGWSESQKFSMLHETGNCWNRPRLVSHVKLPKGCK